MAMARNPILFLYAFVVIAVLNVGFGVSAKWAALVALLLFLPLMYLVGLWRMRRKETDFRRRHRF
jgi:hypothetical protein